MTINPIDQAAVKLGYQSRLAFGVESAYGVRAAPDRSLEFRSESLSASKNRIESEALRSSEFSPRWGKGTEGVAGDVVFELADMGFGFLFEHALGAVATTELVLGEAYRHRFTPGDMHPKSLTAQVVRGGDVPFDYTGLKVTSLEMACSVGEIAVLTANFAGRAEQTDQTAHVEAFPDGFDLFTFVHGTIELGGAEIPVNQAGWTLENSLDIDRHRLGSAHRRVPQRSGFRQLTGSFNADFQDLTHYNRFVSGEHAALTLNFEGGPIGTSGEFAAFVLRTEVRTDGNTPTVQGPQEIRQELEWRAFPSTALPDTVEIDYVTSDATP
jgi:hypothetical protein